MAKTPPTAPRAGARQAPLEQCNALALRHARERRRGADSALDAAIAALRRARTGNAPATPRRRGRSKETT